LIQSKYSVDEEYKLESFNKELVKCLEEKYSIRENLQSYMKDAYNPQYNLDYRVVNDYGVSNAVSYIDGLYGYKTQNQLFDFIVDRYGPDTRINISDNKVVIETISYSITDCFLPDTDVIQKVLSNVRNTNMNIKSIVIKIDNGNKEKAGHIKTIKHTVSLDIYRKWSKVIYFADGRKEVSPSRSIPSYCDNVFVM
jgi:hypothetical protein